MAEENKYVVFTLGKETYGIPILKIENIERMMDITPIPRTPSFVKGITNLRGKIIPVLDLKQKFGIGTTEETDRVCIIIVNVQTEQGIQKNGLMVDEVSEVLDISEGFIEPVPKYSNTQINQEFMSGIGKVKEKIVDKSKDISKDKFKEQAAEKVEETHKEKVIILLDIQKILEPSEVLASAARIDT